METATSCPAASCSRLAGRSPGLYPPYPRTASSRGARDSSRTARTSCATITTVSASTSTRPRPAPPPPAAAARAHSSMRSTATRDLPAPVGRYTTAFRPRDRRTSSAW